MLLGSSTALHSNASNSASKDPFNTERRYETRQQVLLSKDKTLGSMEPLQSFILWAAVAPKIEECREGRPPPPTDTLDTSLCRHPPAQPSYTTYATIMLQPRAYPPPGIIGVGKRRYAALAVGVLAMGSCHQIAHAFAPPTSIHRRSHVMPKMMVHRGISTSSIYPMQRRQGHVSSTLYSTSTADDETPKIDQVLSKLTSLFPLFVLGSAILGSYAPQTLNWVNSGNCISMMLAG